MDGVTVIRAIDHTLREAAMQGKQVQGIEVGRQQYAALRHYCAQHSTGSNLAMLVQVNGLPLRQAEVEDRLQLIYLD